MTEGSVNVFRINKGTKLNDIYKENIEHAKKVLYDFELEPFDDLVSFSPTMFVITKTNLYYILLDTDVSDAERESPLKQVIPILAELLARQEIDGEVLAYQVIAEAWTSKGKTPDNRKFKHGDIQKMPSRQEVLVSIIQEKGKKVKSDTYDIIRADDSNKVTDLKLQKVSRADQHEGEYPRTPPIPTDPKALKLLTTMYKSMLGKDKRLCPFPYNEHDQDWVPEFSKSKSKKINRGKHD